jgi:uncharacterized protein (DUF302 family)
MAQKEGVMSYYFGKTLEIGFEKAVNRVIEELQREGFGILTDIDVRATLKKKLNVDFSPPGGRQDWNDVAL